MKTLVLNKTVKISLTNLALFSVSKNIDISKFSICGGGGGGGGGVKISLFDPRNRSAYCVFYEKRYRSINIGYIINNTSNTIPLRVRSISELRCSTRKFAVR